ncbi:hypothetical protein ACSVDA_11960 [Cytobacillus sp. Hm23]
MAHFKYVEKTTTTEKMLNFLKEEVTGISEYDFNSDHETATANNWTLFSEETAGELVSSMVLKTTAALGDPNQPVNKDIYLKFTNLSLEPRVNALAPENSENCSMTIQVLEDFDSDNDSFGIEGPEVLFAWADEAFEPTDRSNKKPVYVYLNFTNNRISMVAVADPAVNFSDYRKSFMYAGAITPFEYNYNDIDGNILVTAGCVLEEPTMATVSEDAPEFYFGEYTSMGNTSFQMYRTFSGIEFQKHYPSFITQAPKPGNSYVDNVLGDTGLHLDEQGFQASKWTDRYHLSPIYIMHPYEGYRGKLTEVIGVTNHNILHLDELIIDVEGKPWEKEVYKYFDINANQQFTQYSANIDTGVAILKEVRYPGE